MARLWQVESRSVMSFHLCDDRKLSGTVCLCDSPNITQTHITVLRGNICLIQVTDAMTAALVLTTAFPCSCVSFTALFIGAEHGRQIKQRHGQGHEAALVVSSVKKKLWQINGILCSLLCDLMRRIKIWFSSLKSKSCTHMKAALILLTMFCQNNHFRPVLSHRNIAHRHMKQCETHTVKLRHKSL